MASGKIDSSSPVITLKPNSSGSRKQGGPADGHDDAGADRLHVADGPGELRVDLGLGTARAWCSAGMS